MRKAKLLFILALLPGGMLAQERVPPKLEAGMGRLYWSSTAFLAVGTTFDAATSWGRPEANPLLRSRGGRFGARAAGLKLGMLAGTVAIETRCLKRHRRAMAIANFAAGGLLFGVGAANLTRR